MRMYAACLASYNNGVLHGEWFDLEDYDDAEDLLEDIKSKVLMTSKFPNVTVEIDCPDCYGYADECPRCDGTGDIQVPSAEEWAAHDWEGDGLSEFGEYPNLEEVLTHVRMVSEHGDAWLAYVSLQGANNATEEDFTDCYLGTCESPRDYFEENLQDSGLLNRVPDELRPYIDFEAYARDQELNGGYCFESYNGTTFVFSS